MILSASSQAKALAKLTHTPVAYNQLLLAPALQAANSGEVPEGPSQFIFGIGGDEATAVYLFAKIAANILALVAAVRQYGYSQDNADLAANYSKMAERRRANYDLTFKPKEATYVGMVRAEPYYNPNYIASDALASEVSIFSVYPRMRLTTPEILTKQRDNFDYGVNNAFADSADYGRRREENKADKKNEDRANILFATSQLAFKAGEASIKIAQYGTQMYQNAVSIRSEYTTSIITDAVQAMTSNIEYSRSKQMVDHMNAVRTLNISDAQIEYRQPTQAQFDINSRTA